MKAFRLCMVLLVTFMGLDAAPAQGARPGPLNLAPPIGLAWPAPLTETPRPVIVSLAEPGQMLGQAEIARRQDRMLGLLGPERFHLTGRYDAIAALAGRMRLPDAAYLRSLGLPGVDVAPDPQIQAYLDESVPFIGADKLKRQGIGGKGIRVLVMDTGVDVDHFDLKDAVVDQICTLKPADRCGPEGKPADDKDGHGTHVAGIIASRGKRSDFGVAPEAEIVAMKFLEERASGAGSNMVETLDLVLKRDDIHIVNMSLGTNLLYTGSCDAADAYTKALSQAFAKLRAKGVISVAASGNDGSPNKMGAPACIDNVISVGAVEIGADAKLADFTNRSATLDLLAPGVGIDAPIPGNKVGTKQGTSMAAPHVAGALALLKQAVPWAGQDALEAVLKENGQRPTTRVGDNEVSSIKVDKALAVLRLFTPTVTPPIPPSATASPTRTTAPPASETPTEQPIPSASHTPTEGVATATRSPGTATPTDDGPATATPSAGRVYLPLLRRDG